MANKGNKNNGQPGDVILAWFKPLDESFDGAEFNNEIYLMVVNGLTETNGTAANCAQEIKLNFTSALRGVERLNALTGQPEVQVLSQSTNGIRQLVLNLNGGDAALFKFSDGAPFVGAPVSGSPVIVAQPENFAGSIGGDALFSTIATGSAPLKFQWTFNGTNILGATANTYIRTNVQPADAGNYSVVVTNREGTTSSAPATLSLVIPPPPPPLLYEPFDYTNIGGAVSANTPVNWVPNGSNGSDDFNMTADSLSYPGLPDSIGNSATNGGAGSGRPSIVRTNLQQRHGLFFGFV